MTIARVLGIPRGDLDYFYEPALKVAAALEPAATAEAIAESDPAMALIMDYFAERLRDAERREPGTVLDHVGAAVTADKLDLDSAISLLVVAFGAGHDTCRSAIARAGVALARNGEYPWRDEWRAFLPGVADELQRLYPPAALAGRLALRPQVVAELEIPAGQWVMISVISANRDPRAYDDPAALIPTRQGPLPITFGGGHHRCPGEVLAGVQVAAAIQAIIRAMDGGWMVDEASVVHSGQAFLPTIKSARLLRA